MNPEPKIIFTGLGIAALTGITGLYITNNLNLSTLAILSGLFIGAVIIVLVTKKGFFEDKLDQLSGTQSSNSYLDAKSRDETFDWINDEFLGDDKKEGREIIDDRGNTRHQMLSINTSDGTDYVYRAIKAPYNNSDNYALYIVVDCMTDTVLMDDTVQKKTQIKGDMFETCPEVKRMRKMNRSQGLTTEQLRQQSQQMAVNPMMTGMYGGVQNQGGDRQKQSTSSDSGSDSGESGDE